MTENINLELCEKVKYNKNDQVVQFVCGTCAVVGEGGRL